MSAFVSNRKAELPGSTETVLALDQVSKEYPGPTVVLRDVTLAIGKGELVAIVGPSGSGKTTLLQIMGTLDRPTVGAVHLAGHDVLDLSDGELAALRARRIGFVFQQFFLLDGMSAAENVANGLLYSGVPSRLRRTLAIEALERVGLGHRVSHHAGKLSGGERQRVAIARALLGRPAIIFADEPTGNLDSRSSAEIIELIHELNEDGATIVVITHDLEIAKAMPRQITLLDGALASDSGVLSRD